MLALIWVSSRIFPDQYKMTLSNAVRLVSANVLVYRSSLTSGDLTSMKDRLNTLYPHTKRKLAPALDTLSAIVDLATAFGVKSKILFRPAMARNAEVSTSVPDGRRPISVLPWWFHVRVSSPEQAETRGKTEGTDCIWWKVSPRFLAVSQTDDEV